MPYYYYQWDVGNCDFSAFAGYIFGIFRDKANIITSQYGSLVGIPLIPQ